MLRRLVTRAVFAGLCTVLALATQSTRAAEPVLDMGVFPYLSTQGILKTYQPVRAYLEANLNRAVQLSTAQDFPAFVSRSQRGEFDLLITAPHFARLAQREAGYQPLAQYTPELSGIVVVSANSPIRNIQNLRGHSLAAPSRLAVVTMMGLRELAAEGLKPGRDFSLQILSSHASAVISVNNGENAAALTEASALRQMPNEIRQGVRVLTGTGKVQSVTFLAHKRLDRSLRERIKKNLLHFDQTPEGRTFLKSSGYNGLHAVSDKNLRALDVYMPELKDQLRLPP